MGAAGGHDLGGCADARGAPSAEHCLLPQRRLRVRRPRRVGDPGAQAPAAGAVPEDPSRWPLGAWAAAQPGVSENLPQRLGRE